MAKRPHALLLKFPGTNCDEETARALETVGFTARTMPFFLIERDSLDEVDLVVLPGGFSYGDYVMAGRLAQLQLEQRMGSALHEFRERGGLILGICNGFQILMRLGLLPEGSLMENSNGRFICRWVFLKNCDPSNPFLAALPEYFELPVAHAEGRFVTAPGKAGQYRDEGLITLAYSEDVNGSALGIAGMRDASGRVFGLMPHPERFLYREDHYDPDWNEELNWGWGYAFFKSIYVHIVNRIPVSAVS